MKNLENGVNCVVSINTLLYSCLFTLIGSYETAQHNEEFRSCIFRGRVPHPAASFSSVSYFSNVVLSAVATIIIFASLKSVHRTLRLSMESKWLPCLVVLLSRIRETFLFLSLGRLRGVVIMSVYGYS